LGKGLTMTSLPASPTFKERMMALFQFRKTPAVPAPQGSGAQVESFLKGYSIEVMPRTAEKVADFRTLLPKGTRVYIAHIEGTPIEDMVATAKRINGEGYEVMPHFPARIIPSKATLADWIARYQGEANVTQALLLGGGVNTPAGDFDSSMQMMETGLFDGFKRLHVAGHPEGNKDIDKDGGDAIVLQALKWKQAFSDRSDAEMAIATQFCFEAAPVIDWANRLAAEGIKLPIHIGVAGPAKLQTLIKFAIACGVGPSLRVLQKRALDVTKLLLPYEPTDVVAELAAHKAANPAFGIEQVHFFPLGGIKTNAEWVTANGGASGKPAIAA
jgi:methylenetetrahydrofolate reductase (NADPH)